SGSSGISRPAQRVHRSRRPLRHPRSLRRAGAAGVNLEADHMAKDHESADHALLLADLGLSTRVQRNLSRRGIATLGDLVRCSEVDLLDAYGFGMASLQEVKDTLAERGLTLAEPKIDKTTQEILNRERKLNMGVTELMWSIRARFCLESEG